MTQMRQGNLRAERVDFPYFNSRGGRFAKLQLVLALEAARAAAFAAAPARRVAAAGPRLPGDDQFPGQSGGPITRGAGAVGPGGPDDRGLLVRPRLAPGREGDHGEEYAVGAVDACAAGLLRPGRGRGGALRPAGGTAGHLSDAPRIV